MMSAPSDRSRRARPTAPSAARYLLASGDESAVMLTAPTSSGRPMAMGEESRC